MLYVLYHIFDRYHYHSPQRHHKFMFLVVNDNAIYSVLSPEEYPGDISEALDVIPFRVKWFYNFPVTPSDGNGCTGHNYDL